MVRLASLPRSRSLAGAAYRPAVLATTFALALAIAYLCAPLMGGDLSAQLFRANFARVHPLTPIDLRWFGGTLPFGYSLWVPPVMAWLGTRLTGAVAAVAATWLTTRLMQRAGARRPTLGGIAAAVCQASNLAEGRVTFAVGLAFGLASLLALTGSSPRRRYYCAAAALVAGAASPVAALLLWLAAGTTLLRHRIIDAAVLLVASGLPLIVTTGLFADGGRQLFNTSDAVRAALASALVAVLLPRRYPAIRIGAVLGLTLVIAAYVLPTPVGGNAIRLTLLFAVPVVAAFIDWPWWLAAIAIIVTATVQTPVTLGTLTGAGAPATHASYYTPLTAEIHELGPVTGRVEVPELTGHWEAYYVARNLPLARGWLRQLDTELNGKVFYDHLPNAANYQTWLAGNAVQYVAVADARLTFYGKREATLIATALPYLDIVWHNDHWTLYKVANPVPIVASPGTLISETATSITFSAPPNSEVRINVRWFGWLSTGRSNHGCIKRNGDMVVFETVRAESTYTLTSSVNGTQC